MIINIWKRFCLCDWATFRALVWKMFYEHRSLFYITGLYGIVGFALVSWLGIAGQGFFQVSFYSPSILLMVWAYFLAFVLLYWLWLLPQIGRHRFEVRALWLEFYNRFLQADRLVGFILIILVLPIFASIYTSVKQLIPLVHPYSWDLRTMEWDRLLHGGRLPWQWLRFLSDQPWLTVFWDWIYNFWFFVMLGMIFWQAASRDRFGRMQFFLAYIFDWIIIGNVFAMLLSSAGPCFYNLVVGHVDPYRPLMQYLHWVNAHYHPLDSVYYQHLLGSLYRDHGVAMYAGGISAMPSMHVGAAVLFALTAGRRYRWLGRIMWVFALCSFIATITLGWHTAVDGYVGGSLSALIWYSTGWVLRRWNKRSPTGKLVQAV